MTTAELDRIEALAKAADENVRAYAAGWMGGKLPQRDFHEALSPEVALRLVALAREALAWRAADETDNMENVARRQRAQNEGGGA